MNVKIIICNGGNADISIFESQPPINQEPDNREDVSLGELYDGLLREGGGDE